MERFVDNEWTRRESDSGFITHLFSLSLGISFEEDIFQISVFMRYILTLFLSFLFVPVLLGQMPTDFYFKSPLPKNCSELKKTPPSFIGVWQSKKDTMRTFHFSENKIHSEYKHLIISPKKDFIASGYTLKDGYVYGFSDKDSLPAFENNDTIIFCYINEHEIIHFVKETGDEFLAEVKGGLILSRKIDSVYAYSYISMEKGELVISEVDHEPKLDKVLALTKAEAIEDDEETVKLYLADPDKKKMEKFITEGFFNEIQKCKRIEHP